MGRDAEPPRPVVRLLNDLADVMTALRLAGLSPDAVGRICRAVAEARLTARPAVAPREIPEWGWRAGCWTRLDLPDPLEDTDEHGQADDESIRGEDQQR